MDRYSIKGAFAVECGVEEIFAEPVNARGPGLRVTQEALSRRSYEVEASEIGAIRQKREWSRCVVRLIANIQQSVRTHFDIDRMRILLYPSRLTPSDEVQIRRDDAGVVWLGKQPDAR